MSEMTKSHFHQSNPKSKFKCIITTNRSNVSPKLCVNESAKDSKNDIDIRLCFQQVHQSKVRIIIHIC